MANTIVELLTLRFRAKDNLDGTFLFSTHDMAGGAGVADATIEIQGYRMLAHDNGDGTFSLVTTVTTGAGDQVIKHEGLAFKIHPTGGTITIGGIVSPVYALVVNVV